MKDFQTVASSDSRMAARLVVTTGSQKVASLVGMKDFQMVAS
ncbi:hypothetical protein ACHAW6_001334 [Cyclotella cf. meneghiniana]